MKEYLLKDLLEIKNGKDHSILKDGNIPVLGSGGVMRYVDDFLYDDESILLPRKGSLSNIQYVDEPFWTVDTLYYTMVNKEKCTPYYLYYYLKLLDLSNLNTGTGVPSMTYDSYYNIRIKLPSPSTQRKIAQILSTLDDKIELNNRINAELEDMAKLLYDYWFVQFEFPIPADSTSGVAGKPYKSSGGKMVYNKTLKREIPERWEVKRLREISNITMGQSPPGKSYNENNKGMLFFQGSTDFNWRFPTNRVYTTEPKRLAFENDILISVRAPVGAINIAMENCCIGRGLAAINEKNGYNSFLIYQMNYFERVFQSLNSVGTTFGSLTKSQLHNLELIYPQSDVLRSFENNVSVLDGKIKMNSIQNQHLSSLRDWLLPMLINGQVSVEKGYEIVERELDQVLQSRE